MKNKIIISVIVILFVGVAIYFAFFNKTTQPATILYRVTFYQTYKDYCNCLDCGCPSGPKQYLVLEVKEGEKATKPNNPSQDGREFIGWVLDDEANSELFDFDTPITKDIKLYSKWKENRVTCTGTMTEDSLTIKAEIVGNFDANNKLTDATLVYDLGDKTTAEQYCSLFKLFEDSEKGISISCSESKITIKGYEQMEDEESKKNLVGASKDDFIKTMEQEGITCKQ